MLRRVLLAAFFTAGLAAPASAENVATLGPVSNDILCQVLEPCAPPARFAHGPFLATPVVKVVPFRQVQAICGGSRFASVAHDGNEGFGIMGCAQLSETRCVVHVPAEFKAKLPSLYRLVLAHELGHCRGWVHRHY